jgi:hypothetical protein
MQAIDLFNQNFAAAESLIQIYQVFRGLQRTDLSQDLHLAICRHWGDPENAILYPSCNQRVLVVARATNPIPASLISEGGLDFLLRQTIVIACTSLEAFFWDSLRENVLTIVQARRRGADESIRKLTFTLEDYLSIQEYEDPDLRLKQIILKNFERGTLYSTESIDKIANILAVKNIWERVEQVCGEKEREFKSKIGELIQRRNQIAHRADRPEEGEQPDGLGLRPINLAWTNSRVEAAKTLVHAAALIFEEAMKRLEQEIATAKEQEEARRLAAQASQNSDKEQ